MRQEETAENSVVSRFRNAFTIRTLLSLALSDFDSTKRHNINIYACNDVLIWNDMEGHFKVFSNLVKEPQKNNLAIRFLLVKLFFSLKKFKIDFVKNASSGVPPSKIVCQSKCVCLRNKK